MKYLDNHFEVQGCEGANKLSFPQDNDSQTSAVCPQSPHRVHKHADEKSINADAMSVDRLERDAHIIKGGAVFGLLAVMRFLTAAIAIMRQRILLTLKGSSGMIFHAMKCKRSYAHCVALNKRSSKYALIVACVWENISVQHASFLIMTSQRHNTTAMVVEFAELVDMRISSTVLDVVRILCNDCGASSDVQFHVVAQKCLKCNLITLANYDDEAGNHLERVGVVEGENSVAFGTKQRVI